MLHSEMERRKGLFSEFGGDYAGYCRNSGKTVPNIVVLLNNYSGFSEQFEDLQESFTLLTRDGVKYGIYFAVTAGNTNAVRYKTQQNFKMMLTMQLNDATDYSLVVGKTDGLIPSKYKGRGLVSLDRVYEFQTAYCKDVDDIQDYLRTYCFELREKAETFAKPIPVLPNTVDVEYVKPAIKDIKNIPIGVNKKSLNIASIKLANKVVFPVVAQEIYEAANFTEELIRVLALTTETIVVDVEQLFGEQNFGVSIVNGNYEKFVQNLFSEMAERNNTYKDAKMDISSLDKYDERVYVFVGFKRMCEQLTADGKEKLGLLLEKAESFYKLHFVIVESLTQLNTYSYDAWYKRQITGADGLWIGDGVADQYMLKINKITSDLYDENGNEYGYVIVRNRPTLIKLLSPKTEEEVE